MLELEKIESLPFAWLEHKGRLSCADQEKMGMLSFAGLNLAQC
jgi:hypothetical protein